MTLIFEIACHMRFNMNILLIIDTHACYVSLLFKCLYTDLLSNHCKVLILKSSHLHSNFFFEGWGCHIQEYMIFHRCKLLAFNLTLLHMFMSIFVKYDTIYLNQLKHHLNGKQLVNKQFRPLCFH